MQRSFAVALFAGLCCHQAFGQGSCPIANNQTTGSVLIQLVNTNYTVCKECASALNGCTNCPVYGFPCPDENALCEVCSKPLYNAYQYCDYSWIRPWVTSLGRDTVKFCGGSSSASSMSFSSGSQSSLLSDSSVSIPSSGSWKQSSLNSGAWSNKLNDWQIFGIVVLICCCCLCCGGGIGGGYYAYSKKKKGNRYTPQDDDQDYYEDGSPVEGMDYKTPH